MINFNKNNVSTKIVISFCIFILIVCMISFTWWFINKDKTDIRIENLILVSNQENGILNKCYSKISNPESHLLLIVMSKIRAEILNKKGH